MQLSRRLRTVAAMVPVGCRLADIGTDHAYIPIYLVQEGIIPSAIAADINRGPLARAQENIRRYGLENRIETRLSDGLHALRDGEMDAVLIAGMGGLLTVRILEEGKPSLAGCRELILQPQSELRSVRAYLEEEGYAIVEEDLVLEEGKYYPMMRAVKQALSGPRQRKLQEVELCYGPLLLEKRHPLLYGYLSREETLACKVLDSLKGKRTDAVDKRRSEMEWELELLRCAMAACR